jgi:hypothetical protein
MKHETDFDRIKRQERWNAQETINEAVAIAREAGYTPSEFFETVWDTWAEGMDDEKKEADKQFNLLAKLVPERPEMSTLKSSLKEHFG